MRLLRNYLYFLVGVALSALLMAPAFASSGITLAYEWIGLNGPRVSAMAGGQVLGPVVDYTKPVVSSLGGGSANLASSGSLSLGAAAGARSPVTVPVAVASRLSPMAIAKAAVRLTPTGIAVGILAPLILEAGLEYLDGQWKTKGAVTTGDGFGETTAAASTPNTPVSYWYVGSSVYSSISSAASAQCASTITYPDVFSTTSVSGGQDLVVCSLTQGGVVYKTPAQGLPQVWRCPGSSSNIGNGETNPPSCSGVSYSCPSGHGWTLSGSTCNRPACAAGEARDSSGACVASSVVVSQAVAEQMVAAKIPADPTPIVNALPADTPLDLEPAAFSGPASVSSDPVTTTDVKRVPSVDSATGQTTYNNVTTTTSTSTVVNITYEGNTATYNVVNKTETKDSAGNVLESTTTPGVPDPNAEETVPAVTDTALDPVPTLYERKYPDGIKGVWNTRSAELKATPLFSLASVFAPSGIGAGTCPSWTFNANIGPGMMFGTGSVSPPCWIWPVLKAILIISALYVSRGLIFGG